MLHRNTRLLAFASVLMVAAASPLASAAEGYFLKDAPVSRMTKDDFQIANGVIRSALEEGRDGEAYAWENPATGASGSVTPRTAFVRDGKTCRRAQFAVSAGGLKNVSSWTLCKLPDGWKAVDD